jgi:hypothetical protein
VGRGRGGGAHAPPSVRAGQAAMETFSVAPLAWGGCQIKVAVLSSPRLRLDPPGRRPLLAWIRAPVWRGRAGDAPRPALPYRSRGRRAHRARRAPRKAKRWAESIPVMSSTGPQTRAWRLHRPPAALPPRTRTPRCHRLPEVLLRNSRFLQDESNFYI